MAAAYIRHKVNESLEKMVHEDYIAKLLFTLASGQVISQGREYHEVRESIYKPILIDTRSADDVIADTLKKHGLRLKEEGKQ